jgi:hypothetical protein
MSQELIAKFEHAGPSEAQVRWFLKEFETQRDYFDRRLEKLSRKIATANILILILAVAFSSLIVVAAILLAFVA